MHQTECAHRVYENRGNPLLLNLLPLARGGRLIDCGCGAGNNSHILQARGWRVTGLTISARECELAAPYCESVHLVDLEAGLPDAARGPYHAAVASHVLEHLAWPNRLLRDLARALVPGGVLAVALPNVLEYGFRCRFALGRFEYDKGGTMDDTHLRFYTFESGKRLLVENGYEVLRASVDGVFPLGRLRRVLAPSVVGAINSWAGRIRPGLFGAQSLYLARPV